MDLMAKLQSGDPLALGFFLGAFSALATIWSLYYQSQVWRWPSVWGVLNKSEVESISGGAISERQHKAEVSYAYTVRGADYVGQRLSAMVVTASGGAVDLVGKQLKGIETDVDGRVKVYHHPTKPQKSFLIRGSKTQVAFTLCYFLISVAVVYVCAARLDLT